MQPDLIEAAVPSQLMQKQLCQFTGEECLPQGHAVSTQTVEDRPTISAAAARLQPASSGAAVSSRLDDNAKAGCVYSRQSASTQRACCVHSNTRGGTHNLASCCCSLFAACSIWSCSPFTAFTSRSAALLVLSGPTAAFSRLMASDAHSSAKLCVAA